MEKLVFGAFLTDDVDLIPKIDYEPIFTLAPDFTMLLPFRVIRLYCLKGGEYIFFGIFYTGCYNNREKGQIWELNNKISSQYGSGK